MDELVTMRCCMCPNIQSNTRTCPGIPGTPHPIPGVCRFVRKYIDARGWKYRVMSGIGGDTFKARYQKPEKTGSDGWKGVAAVPWRKTFDEAQEDLNRLACDRGWEVWND